MRNNINIPAKHLLIGGLCILSFLGCKKEFLGTPQTFSRTATETRQPAPPTTPGRCLSYEEAYPNGPEETPIEETSIDEMPAFPPPIDTAFFPFCGNDSRFTNNYSPTETFYIPDADTTGGSIQ